MRDIPEIWRKAGYAAAGLALCEIGLRIALPGIDGVALQQYLGQHGTGLLRAYDFLAVGGVSRGALLALGALPYLSARLFMRLSAVSFPTVRETAPRADDTPTRQRWTRVLTIGLALVQSYGFARFVSSVPGAVSHPGAGFIVETMLVLTTGTTLLMLLGERLAASGDLEVVRDPHPEVVRDAGGEADPPSLTRGAAAATPVSPRDHRSTLDLRSSGS